VSHGVTTHTAGHYAYTVTQDCMEFHSALTDRVSVTSPGLTLTQSVYSTVWEWGVRMIGYDSFSELPGTPSGRAGR
jgi:hypothetical protein